MTTLQDIRPEPFRWFDYSRYSFSLGLRSGGRAWLSGHSASEYDTGEGRIVVRGAMAEQARTAYDKIGAIVAAAGLRLTDVERVVEYVTAAGVAHYDDAEAVRSGVLGDQRPALSTVVVDRLLRPQAQIEIEVTVGGHGAPVGDPAGRPAFAPARRTGDLLYLSSLRDDRPGDLASQAEGAFRVARRRMEEAGLAPANLAKTVVYVAAGVAEDLPSVAAARRRVFGDVAVAETEVVMTSMASVRTLVSLDVVAAAGARRAIGGSGGRPAAVAAGGLVLCSGVTAGGSTGEVGDDVVLQAEGCYQALLATLEHAGASSSDLVKTIEYVTPGALDGYRKVGGVRQALLTTPFPASTGAVCAALPTAGAGLLVDAFALDPRSPRP